MPRGGAPDSKILAGAIVSIRSGGVQPRGAAGLRKTVRELRPVPISGEKRPNC
jgi:ABC-type arginine/histidine transport system permease subunit